MNRRTHLGQWLSGALALASTTLPLRVRAAAFPERPITLVVPFTAGGPTDAIARLMAEEMGRTLGQPVVVDNKPGANTIIGAQVVAKSAPDGYTLLMATAGTLVTNSFLYKELSYDADRDLDLLQMANTAPLIAVVSSNSSIKTFDDLIALAKARPKAASFASVGVGGIYQLAFELLQEIAGIQMTHVPYKGSAQAQIDVISGNVDVMFDTPTSTLSQIQAGKLRPIAVTSPRRFSLLPEVPAVVERYPAFVDTVVWSGVVAPKGLPSENRAKLKSAVDKALSSEKYIETARKFGMEQLKPWSSEELSKFIKAQRATWGEVIRRNGIHA